MNEQKNRCVFTDDDLKMMKDMGRMQSDAGHEFIDAKIQALIVRLEAAEKVASVHRGGFCCVHTGSFCGYSDIVNAWRTAAGKDE